ncbi:MAG: hypothetical protein SynsKO_32590 [Synoicihabitans sp.]
MNSLAPATANSDAAAQLLHDAFNFRWNLFAFQGSHSGKFPLPPVSSLRSQFENQFPAALYFEADHLDGLDIVLRKHRLLLPGETILRTEKPGEGNMNFVVRVITTRRSLIVKQSRPWVEKYPQIAAPVERLRAEAAYYRVTLQEPTLSAMSPALLAVDSDHLLMVTEDLGTGSDYTSIYAQGSTLSPTEMEGLFTYLAELHHTSQDIDPAKFPLNQELKELNHAHIFDLPFRPDTEMNLDAIQPGLNQLALPVHHDETLRQHLQKVGEIYLGSGPVLIHGDFYPGSWLRTAEGLKVIDPEFSFFGHAEFDVAVMIAHLLMARVPLESIRHSLASYLHHGSLDAELLVEFVGAEILRRLLGLAQLPLDLDLAEKAKLIELARGFIHDPTSHPIY